MRVVDLGQIDVGRYFRLVGNGLIKVFQFTESGRVKTGLLLTGDFKYNTNLYLNILDRYEVEPVCIMAVRRGL